MGATAKTGLRWLRRVLALICLMNVSMFVWNRLADPQRPAIDPGLRASTQKDISSNVYHPDLRGEWKLDLEVSDSVAPLLRTVGKSEWTILLASKAAVTHIIRGDLRRLTLLIKTPVRNQKQELLLDGTPTRAIGPDGGETWASTRWSEDGQSLITTTQASDRQTLSFRITRSLASDRRTMFLDVQYQGKDGNPIRVRRVFRLVVLPLDPSATLAG
jgi:hypothetical protein